jgi:23S rRNA (cytidine1920-2'-O)/16S rRNA (cytidine1409-2'-O)-methyltransferase
MNPTSRQRADLVLVQRGHFESRARAQAAIAAGLVSADGVTIQKASDLIGPEAEIVAAPPHPWVSRGGVKLAAALDAFGIDPANQVCVDIGASTGGFTEVLLARGAAHVYAVDVGRGQLHPRIAADPRVTSLEQTDARALSPTLIPEPIDLLVMDVSFISQKLVLPAGKALLKDRGALVTLIKPQFEAGRTHLDRGIVRDETVRAAVCDSLKAFVESLGFAVIGVIRSPIAGGDGNQEYLLGAHLG